MQENMIEQNIIISEPCRNLRALGRNALKDKWKTAIIAVLVYIIVVQFPQLVFDSLLGTNIVSLLQPDTYYNLYPYIDIEMYNDMPKMSFLSPIYILLVTGALELGVSIFFLATFRRHDVNVSDVFLGFERFGKALGLFLFRALFTFLWTCLFFVPGIIASIRYSQAFFILADDPDKGIRQCMNESKAMMKGNKATYFVLTLSFIGWILLSAIPAGIIEGMGSIVSDNQFVIALFSLIGALCIAPVTAYMYSTFAGFYEILAGHLIKETKPIPVTVEEAKKQYEEMQAKPSEEAEAETAEAETEAETEAAEEKEEVEKTDEQ